MLLNFESFNAAKQVASIEVEKKLLEANQQMFFHILIEKAVVVNGIAGEIPIREVIYDEARYFDTQEEVDEFMVYLKSFDDRNKKQFSGSVVEGLL